MATSVDTYQPPTMHTLRDVLHDLDHPAVVNVLDADTSSSSSPPPLDTVSHATLRRRVLSFASSLRARGYASDTVISLVMPNCGDFVEAFLAVTVSGMAAAPLNPGYTSSEFDFYLSDLDTSLILISSSIPGSSPIHGAAAARNIPVIVYASEDKDDVDKDAIPDIDAEATALFLHTSGTTSRPKGVPLSQRNLVSSIANIAATYQLTEADKNLLVMPLFHVHGLMAATLTTLATKGTIIIPPGGKFSASKFWPSVRLTQPTWFTAVPTMHQILLARAGSDYEPIRESLTPFRFIRSCSASLAPAVLGRMNDMFGAPVLEAYAMTEAAHQMTSNPLPKHGASKPGSVGTAQGGVSVTILDDANKEVEVGTVGEVCIRGRNVTKGYHRNESANEKAFAGGWFHTGDQGKLDKDGYLTLTGRIKELVNRGGEKISPLEVDAALLAHAAVKEAVSFAVPDDMYGEEVNAAVILTDDSKDSVTSEELTEFAKGKLALFKIPKRFFICDYLPRTATGKIQRRIVAKHFLEAA